MAGTELCSTSDECPFPKECKRHPLKARAEDTQYRAFGHLPGECNFFFRDETDEERLEAENEMMIERMKENYLR